MNSSLAFPFPGIHYGVPESTYHAAKGMASKSVLWDFVPNPHRWFYGPEKVATSAMNWGSLVDALTLSPEDNSLFIISPYDDFKKKEAQEWRDAQTVPVIKWAEYEAAILASEVLEDHPIAGGIIEASTPQVSVVADGTDPETGEFVRVKARIDMVPRKDSAYREWLFDLKTIDSLYHIEKAIANYGYHVQAALYLDAFNWMSPSDDERTRFGFIVQESDPPYEVAVVELDPVDIEAGRAWVRKAIALWCRCHRENDFPSPFENEIRVVSRPGWARKGEDL